MILSLGGRSVLVTKDFFQAHKYVGSPKYGSFIYEGTIQTYKFKTITNSATLWVFLVGDFRILLKYSILLITEIQIPNALIFLCQIHGRSQQLFQGI
jgi:hypothetical protein